LEFDKHILRRILGIIGELKSYGLYVNNNIVITFPLAHEKASLIQEVL
jgi:hypothetical protein